MPYVQSTQAFLRVGEFRFDPERKVLSRDGKNIPLPPKATDVLAVLIEDHGRLVEREQLLLAVWQDTFVEDGNLSNAISTLRKVLGGDGIIQTVPRRGYRFTLEVLRFAEEEIEEISFEKRTITETTFVAVDNQMHGDGHKRLLPSTRLHRRLAILVMLIGILTFTGLAYYFYSRDTASPLAPNQIKSLAVLPLKSFSNDATDELRLKITDALITGLSRNTLLAVRPTNAVLRFDSQTQDSVDAGKELGVDAVLDGRLQVENGKLRVTLQMLSVPIGTQIWAEQFDGNAGEILALQDSISNRLRQDIAIGKETIAAIAVNNDSYEAYLKGRFLWNQRKKESYYSALEYFQRSVALDPNFALGYTGISDVYYSLQQRNDLPVVEAFTKAENAARKAMELDPNLAEAYAAMGVVSNLRYSRWAEAEAYFLRAIELNPNFAETYGRLGMLYNCWGRFEESEAVLRKGLSLEPTSLNLAIYLGANFYFSKQFDRAESQFMRILEFAPGTERAHFFLGRVFEIEGRYDEAVEHLLKERSINSPTSVEALRNAFVKGGIRGFWIKQIEFLDNELKRKYALESHIAARYVLLGDVPNACKYVDLNLTALGSMRNYGHVDPIFDPIRSESCFISLMSRAVHS